MPEIIDWAGTADATPNASRKSTAVRTLDLGRSEEEHYVVLPCWGQDWQGTMLELPGFYTGLSRLVEPCLQFGARRGRLTGNRKLPSMGEELSKYWHGPPPKPLGL